MARASLYQHLHAHFLNRGLEPTSVRCGCIQTTKEWSLRERFRAEPLRLEGTWCLAQGSMRREIRKVGNFLRMNSPTSYSKASLNQRSRLIGNRPPVE